MSKSFAVECVIIYEIFFVPLRTRSLSGAYRLFAFSAQKTSFPLLSKKTKRHSSHNYCPESFIATMSKKAPPKEKWLVFVDTNVFLDFYRQPGSSAQRQLDALERHKSLIITGDQIRMEFLKNRQKVIVESIKTIPKPARISLPNIVQEQQQSKMLARHIANATESHAKIRMKITSILRDPSTHDPVFQSVTRLFNFKGEFNLTRPNKVRFTIRNLARKRFILGYPPRKKEDTSIGDAVNWEWIVWCAQNSAENHHVLIVSRDGDYGVSYDGKAILNDWLRREFKDRVSQKRKIELTDRLTDAMKRLDEHVTEEDESEETKLLTAPTGSPELSE